MIALLAIATAIDIILAGFLVAVSGFILEGVNNTGPMQDAGWFVAFIIFCVVAPIAAWILRKRMPAAVPLVLAFAPIVVGAVVLLLEPAFTR